MTASDIEDVVSKLSLELVHGAQGSNNDNDVIIVKDPETENLASIKQSDDSIHVKFSVSGEKRIYRSIAALESNLGLLINLSHEKGV